MGDILGFGFLLVLFLILTYFLFLFLTNLLLLLKKQSLIKLWLLWFLIFHFNLKFYILFFHLFNLPLSLCLPINFLPSSFGNLFDINIDDIIKSFPQFPSHLWVVVNVLLKKVFLSVTDFGQYLWGATLEKVQLDHNALYKVFLELHQVVDLQVLKGLISQFAISSMMHLAIISFYKILSIFPESKYLIAMLAKVLTWERYQTGLGVRLHPEVWPSRYL